jgi:asparagine synthase (glutamine-hydrolysing)
MCCRISGTVNYLPSVCISMVEKQHKGGPDLNAIQRDGNVVFGHNLLAIIGHQEQPINNAHSMLTFNGCWYNYKDFYPYLTSDTLAVSEHFKAKGIKAIDDINGMFAIGLLDKCEQKIHLFADRFGQKPLYYYFNGLKFAFASNPAALYPLLPSLEIDKEALQSYWLLGSVMGSDGIFKGIKKLCASEHLTYDIQANTVTIERYYEPKFQDNTSGIEDLVVDAIQKVSVSDVPVHIFLSGGIDSTLVASQFQNGNAIHLDSPEYIYAQEVANRFNIDLKRVFPEDIDIEACLTDYSLNSGEPTMAGLIPYITAKEVSKFGRVAITANGADELFFGYERMKNKFEQPKGIFRMSAFNEDHIWVEPPWSENQGWRQWVELQTYIQYDLNKTLDSASMCHGLEVRSPFLDHRLVEMALSIPESVHRKQGNKTILKNMLRKMGFKDQFLNRPKLGFSLHKKPADMEAQLNQAWSWVKREGYLELNDNQLSGRDYQYLRMSALGFYYWHKAWFK